MTIAHFLFSLLLLVVPAPATPSSLVAEGKELYKQGSMGEALLKFEEAVQAGAEDGEMFYQMGYCYKTVRQDAARNRELMQKAAPLLEKQLETDKKAGPAPFYYLSAIYVNDLGDSSKGTDVARRGVAAADEGRFAGFQDAESLFQIGRLYMLAGQKEKAISLYEKVVAQMGAPGSASKAYIVSTLDQLIAYYTTTSDYEKAANHIRRVLEIEPGRDQQRLSAGFLMITAGRYQDALSFMRGITNDDLATEGNYITRIITRWQELGSPSVPAEKAKLDDKAIQEALLVAARKLSEVKQKEDEMSKGAPPQGSIIPAGGQDEVKKRGKRPVVKDPNHPTMEEYEAIYGIVSTPPTPPPPPSAERTAAEREFFALAMEYVRRGHPMREMSLSLGLTGVIFR